MAGRKKEPTALKKLKNNPGRRPLPKNEPEPKIRIPSAPAHLSPYAKTEWKRISRELYNLGLLSGVDRSALGAYCQCYSRWRTAEEHLNKDAKDKGAIGGGLIIKTTNENLIQSPLVGIANKAMADMIKYAAEFGMTPSARTRIEASPIVEDEPTNDMFND